MSQARSAGSLIDEARTRHHAFFNSKVPDGALVMGLNTKQRSLLLQYADGIQPLLDQSVQIAATVNGGLVGIDPTTGTPYYLTTSGAGYPVENAGTVSVPIPYFDFSVPPISLDPFGVSGGTPGFPLPADLVKLIAVVGTYSDGSTGNIDVIPERMRHLNPAHNPMVFINGNRLVPVRWGIPPIQDWWLQITNVTLTYLAIQTVSLASDLLVIPVVLSEALIAHVAMLLAMATPQVTQAERVMFTTLSKDADAAFNSAGKDMVMQLTETAVQYHE